MKKIINWNDFVSNSYVSNFNFLVLNAKKGILIEKCLGTTALLSQLTHWPPNFSYDV